jgi:hypothetical protein
VNNYLGFATIAVIGLAIGSYLKSESKSAEFAVISSIPYREEAIMNMTARQNSNIELNHLYGGVPNPTPINIIRLVTGTPSYVPYDAGVGL